MPVDPFQLAAVVNHAGHAGDEVPEVVPDLHVSTARARRAERDHGTTSRCTPTRSRSHSAARTTERTSPTMIGV